MDARAITHDALLPVPRATRRRKNDTGASEEVVRVTVLLSPAEASALAEGVWTNTAAWGQRQINYGDAALKLVREAVRRALGR